MSEVQGALEESFASKLGIDMVSTQTYRHEIDIHAGTDIVVTAVGPSGIGKSAIPRQAAKARKAHFDTLHMPNMNPEDFSLPTGALDTRTYYDKRVPRLFQAFVIYVEKLKEENGGVFPKGREPILLVDELNRTVDKGVTRAAFTLLENRRVGDLLLPEEVQLVATMNPAGSGYAVNDFDRDPAMRRRLQLLGVRYNYGEFMHYARAVEFHPKVVEHLAAQPGVVYDQQALLAGKVFPCPATWEVVSKICYAMDRAKYALTSEEASAAFSGVIGTAATAIFLEFVKDHTVVITPSEVLDSYTERSDVRTRFRKLVSEEGGRYDKIADLSTGLATQVFADIKRPHQNFVAHLALYMSDLPVDVLMSFIQKLSDESGKVNGGKDYFQRLNQLLVKEPAFFAATSRIQDAHNAVDKEVGASNAT